MDGFRAFEDDAAGHDEDAVIDAPPEIGSDERRMQVRAYNYWVSLLKGRTYPSIEDVEPADLDDFGPHSVLLDFTAGAEDPGVSYLGRALREACEIDGDIRTIADVPPRSLLSRLTDHYLQIIANCAPIGFEAEFVGRSGTNTMYRGILMPLSSDGDTIDFIYGVINWKDVADDKIVGGIALEAERAVAERQLADANPVWADGPNAEPAPIEGDILDLDEFADVPAFDAPGHEAPAFDPDAGLADRLAAARDTADALKGADARSRGALYRALGTAYDFARAAEAEPDDYAELLDDAGLKVQARAPMTPVVKLVFGADYDKARVTEFAAALAWAKRADVAVGAFADRLEREPGGLKAVVAAERKARRPDAKASPAETRRTALRAAPSLATVSIAAPGGEFVLLVARREADGSLGIVAPVAEDQALIDRAIARSLSPDD